MVESISKFKIGTSAAASWAWGTSLIMGQQIALEKGIIAWLIWAACNTLTLALFGLLFRKKTISSSVYNRKEIKIIALIIQLFCLLVQLNFINQQFKLIIGNKAAAYIITAALGCGCTLMVFNKGLPTSIKTDAAQWILAIAAVVSILLVGMFSGAERQSFMPTTSSSISWGIWSGLILFAGPIGDVQHWQRAAEDKSGKAYNIGAVLFGLYMLLILGMAFFKFNRAMDILLLIAVLGVTTSTIDSIAAALHKLGNKTIGTGISLGVCLSFGLYISMGMIDLWSSFGVIRFAFAVGILLMPFALSGKTAAVLPAVVGAAGVIIYFALDGQIAVMSIPGIVSLAVSGVILAYVLTVLCMNRKKKCLRKNRI